MPDWNNDGVDDFMDDIYFNDIIEQDNLMDDISSSSDFNQSSSYSITSNSSSSNYNKYRTTPIHQTTRMPIMLRFFIAAIIACFFGAFSELLGVVVLIIWIIIEVCSS